MAALIGDQMEKGGTRFERGVVVKSVRANGGGAAHKLTVTYGPAGKDGGGEAWEKELECDTLLLAVGRVAETKQLCLERCTRRESGGGIVAIHEKTGKVLTSVGEQSSCPYVYAVGDAAHGKLELTPVAIMAGRLLARRLFGREAADPGRLMRYSLVPTTVFTPMEYSAVGLSEEEATELHGGGEIEVFHSSFTPLEHAVARRRKGQCYCKLIALKKEGGRVVGFHVLGPNAGEVTQGFAVAMRVGARKEDFDMTVGIHPTVAEEVMTLRVTKSSGASAEKTSC